MKNLFFSDTYSVKKCKTILRHTYYAFMKKKPSLPAETQDRIESHLYLLQQSIMEKDRKKSSDLAKGAEAFFETHLKKSQMQKIKNGAITLTLALSAAIVIRQSIFELYEIPTGSMRPTLKEKDRLFVSKTNFGINIPLTTKHLLFDPSLIQRNGIFVFTGEGMDIRDVNTTYFYIFPGKKQYIKRLMGKPGDTLYFYGGQIYGIDYEGNDITALLQPAELKNIEHIPFLYFDGKVLTNPQMHGGIFSPVTILQMNEPVARMYLNGRNQISAEMLSVCPSEKLCRQPLEEYFELWGFKNYGMTRILSKEQARLISDEDITNSNSEYFLEIKHHPSIQSAKLGRDERGRLRPVLGISSSLLPIDNKHMKRIFDNLYTARFVVSNGFAYRYGSSYHVGSKPSFLPHLPSVPDGTYEFYHGKAYKIGWQGIALELDSQHPLYQFSLEKTQMLFNLGIEFDTRFSPMTKFSPMPSRYTYFREKNLYLMGSAIFTRDEEDLISFIAKEKNKEKGQTSQMPYHPFIDGGAPYLADGSLDKELIIRCGLTIPARSYLALGDNHAMSADSRDFGFVPEDNIRGAPDFIFWPVGQRWGSPSQPPYPLFNLPRTIIWTLVGISSSIYFLGHRRKNRLPLPLTKKG